MNIWNFRNLGDLISMESKNPFSFGGSHEKVEEASKPSVSHWNVVLSDILVWICFFGRFWLQKVDCGEKKNNRWKSKYSIQNKISYRGLVFVRDYPFGFCLTQFRFSMDISQCCNINDPDKNEKKNRARATHIVAFTRHFALVVFLGFFLGFALVTFSFFCFFILMCYHIRLLGWFTGRCFDPCSPSIESVLD